MDTRPAPNSIADAVDCLRKAYAADVPAWSLWGKERQTIRKLIASSNEVLQRLAASADIEEHWQIICAAAKKHHGALPDPAQTHKFVLD